MKEVINYIALSTLYMTVFYLFYLLLLSRDTLYTRNRYYLLGTLVISLLLPLVKFTIPGTSGLASLTRGISDVIHIGQVDVINGSGANIASWNLSPLAIIYFTGLTASLAILASNLLSLVRRIRESGQDSPGVILTDMGGIAGFSALGFIFVGDHLGNEDAVRVANHERKHLEYGHFYDIVLVRLVTILFWFNPLIYLFERSLRAVHEYQVDDNLLQNGETVKGYQELMLNQLFRTNIFSVRSAFSGQSLIKKRLIMMTKKRSGKLAELKVFCLLPAIALMLLLFSCKTEPGDPELKGVDEVEVVTPAEAVAAEVPPPSSADKLKDISEDDEVLTVVEVMPTFQGGDVNKFRAYLASNVKYPAIAAENGIQGQVFVQFVVDKTGEIRDINIIRGVDPSLDNEVIRVVEAAPDWTPGKHQGKNVNVIISTAVNFQLQ